MTYEPVFLDPDFRKTPKTKCFCHICQRDLDETKAAKFMIGDDTSCAIHPSDVEDHDQVDIVFAGPECAKRIPENYRIK